MSEQHRYDAQVEESEARIHESGSQQGRITSSPQNAATSMNKVERGRWKLLNITSTARKR